ncbi:hypothetical protein BDB01DRAFT_897121 [Pilobolus umbonatus]|nr:hypothetical protein BDB01DRAFT_897121 [Pilobolus umbonatus]
MADPSQVFKATYSGIPVYEMLCKSVAVMRRKSDSYLNATQILKVAGFDKPQRTRILEREVQTGDHEKVQGGYGKYQGTWVPFERGRSLAELYGVDNILRPLLDFIEGSTSPPLAPKHVTAASSRPKKQREIRTRKKIRHYEDYVSDIELNTPTKEDSTRSSASDKPKAADSRSETRNKASSVETGPLPAKRTRLILQTKEEVTTNSTTDESQKEQKETQEDASGSYAQRLLRCFMNNYKGIPPLLSNPPPDMDINIIIDDEGHTCLHWAAAMARVDILQTMIDNGIDIYRVNYKGQTALMRSVLFTNNYDAKTFETLLTLLQKTIFNIDKQDQTVFHHIATTAGWIGKLYACRYYTECLINKLSHNRSELISLLNVQDTFGDTALAIVSRLGNKKLVKLMGDAGASVELAKNSRISKHYRPTTDKFSINDSTQCSSNDTSTVTTDSNNELNDDDYYSEVNKRLALKEKLEATFKQIVNNSQSAPHMTESFDSFVESYERDLIGKDSLIHKKMIQLDLFKKRLQETTKPLESLKEENSSKDTWEEEAVVLEDNMNKWLRFSQREHLKLMVEMNEKVMTISDDKEMSLDEMKELIEKLQAQLSEQKLSRKKAVEELYQLRIQLPSQRYQCYKRLISTSCNVPYENVDEMLAPLLASFYEAAGSND